MKAIIKDGKIIKLLFGDGKIYVAPAHDRYKRIDDTVALMVTDKARPIGDTRTSWRGRNALNYCDDLVL